MTDLVTAGQKTKLRTDGQAAQVYAIIDAPPTVYSCRVNQTFDTHDMVAEFAFDGGSGTLADVLPDMTVLVGSAAGLDDVGVCRVRKSWDAALAYIGEGSEINWQDDLYITVVDDFGIWARHIRPVSGVFYADYDVAYSDQHTVRDPLITLGGDRVVWLTGATVAVGFTAVNQLGGTTTWEWSSTGGTITNGTTASPTITFDTPGRYRVTATATQSTASFARHVYVHVLGDGYQPLTQFTLNSVDSDSGTVASIAAYGEVSTVRDMSRVIIFERAWYQGTEGSIGVVTGLENILMTGFIAGESIEYNPDIGTVSFDVENAFYWLDRLAQYPSGVENTTGTASAWTNFNTLTVDKAIWHLARWRSTLSRMMDVVLSGDTRECAKLAEGTGSLGGQMRSTASAILAEFAVDRYGRAHVQIPHNLTPVASRTTPTVMTLTDADIQAGVQMRRNTYNQTSQVNLSGVVYAEGEGAALFSLSPGHVFTRFGEPVRVERLALTNQLQANELTGLYHRRANNKYPEITLTLAGINRAFDTAPQGLAYLDISAAKSPRGIGYTGNAIPRRISYQHDPLTGRMTTQITFETETFPAPAIVGDPPSDAGFPPFSPFPPLPPLPPLPPDIPPPPVDPNAQYSVKLLYALTSTNRVLACNTPFGLTKTWVDVTAIGNPTLLPEHFYTDWSTGSLWSHDGNSIYRSQPTVGGDGTLTPTRMYKWIPATALFAGGNPVRNVINSIGINEITGEMAAMLSNIDVPTERSMFVGSPGGLLRRTSISESALWSIPVITLGSGRIIASYMQSTIGSRFKVSDDGGNAWQTVSTSLTYGGTTAFPARSFHFRPNPLGSYVFHFASKGAIAFARSIDLVATSARLDDESLAFDMNPLSICSTPTGNDPAQTIVIGAQRQDPWKILRSLNGGETWLAAPATNENIRQVIWAGYDDTGADIFIAFSSLDGLDDLIYTDDEFDTVTSIGTELLAALNVDEYITAIRAVL